MFKFVIMSVPYVYVNVLYFRKMLLLLLKLVVHLIY